MAEDPLAPAASPASAVRSLQSPSMTSDNRVSDGSAISSNVISTRRKSSAASSWATCSDKSVRDQSVTSARGLLTKSHSTEQKDTSKTLPKSKISTMLSALDRRRKQKLLQADATNLDDAKEVPESETQLPTRTESAPLQSSNKLQPRGPTERQSVSDLREFLKSDPAHPEETHRIQIVKSNFDWDDEDDDDEIDENAESASEVRHSKLQSLHRTTRRWQAAMAGGSNSKAAEGLHGTGMSVDAWMASAQKYAEGRRSEALTSTATGVDSMSGHGSENGSPQMRNKFLAGGKKSVLKLFDDPVWNNEDGELTASIVLGSGRSDYDGPTGAKPIMEGILGANKSVNKEESGRAVALAGPADQVRTSAKGESRDRPSIPTKTEVKVDWFFGTPPLPKSFRYVDWSKHGRGLSVVDAPVFAPDAPQMPISKFSEQLLESNATHKSSKTSILKRLKSQLFESPEAPIFVPVEIARPSSAKPSPVSKFPVPLRRGKSAEDLRLKRSNDDPFTDDATENAMPNVRAVDTRRSLDNNARRFNKEVNSPTKHEKRAIYPVYPELGIYTTNKADLKTSPRTPLPKISDNAETSPRVKGYPKGPEDPNWDDAVKRVKKMVQEREKKEAEEARFLKKELKMQEKQMRMKKLQAGRDVVLRGSQFGLTTKKPLDEITEDEFEAVGGFATTPSKDASMSKKRGIFSMLFTKILGTHQEKEEHVTKTRSKLEKHKSLEVLNFAANADDDESLKEHRDQYERALRALNGDESPSNASSKDKCSPKTSDEKVQEADDAINEKQSLTPNDRNAGVGLGIEAGTQPWSQKRTTSKSYKEFVAQKRQRQTLASEDEPTPTKHDGPALSDISEEDAQSHATLINAQNNDDTSSWCTESIHSIDQIEKMIEPEDESRPPQLSMPDFSREVEHANSQYSGCYAPSSAQDASYHDEDDDAASRYSDQIEMDAMPAPLDIRVLRVKSSSVDTQPAHRNAFVPDRKASFHAKIQEVSRLHQAHIGSLSHPALRGTPQEDHIAEVVQRCSSKAPDYEYDIDPKPNRDSLDSGVGLMSNDQAEHFDEGYATGPTQQTEFPSDDYYKSSKSPRNLTRSSSRTVSAPQWTGGSPTTENNENVDDIDLGALRTEVGVGPLRLAMSGSSAKHPHHPFTWTHEKVMCRLIHNSVEVLPPMPSFGTASGPVYMSRMGSEYFRTSPTKKFAADAKQCANCTSYCCRFANLLNVISNLNSGTDIMEEMVRTKAEQRVTMLRTYHPNGIEEYETFLQCAQCGHRVCPKCAKQCTERLCQSIVCSHCSNESATCPIHAPF